jgi:hypothetical protein
MNGRMAVAGLVFGLVASAGGLEAQEGDARVLEPRVLRFSAGGESIHADARFSAAGTEPVAADFRGPLVPARFAPLAPLDQALRRFPDLPYGGDAPGGLTAGDLGLDVAFSTRTVPITLSMGILSRLELGLRLPVHRAERLRRRLDLAGGNVGLNPDTAANLALLQPLGADAAALGRLPVLPLADSPIGAALQAAVLRQTGGTLALPASPLGPAQLAAVFGEPVEPYRATGWWPGDLEVIARLALPRTFDGPLPPTGPGADYRVTATASVRLPTGRLEPEPDRLPFGPRRGITEAAAGLVADLFLGERFWGTAGVGASLRQPWEETALIAPPEGPLAPGAGIGPVRREGGAGFLLYALPRYRLTEEIAFGASLLAGRAPAPGQGAGAAGSPRSTSLGFSFRYSNLAEPSPRVPLDVAVGYSAALAGSAGQLAERRAYFRFSLERAPRGRGAPTD